MVLNLYGVFDKKSQIYKFPNFVRSEGQAIRSFETGALDLETEIGRYPSDFELYRIAMFDDERGVVIPLEQPQFVVSAQTLVTAAERRKEMQDATR